jgi:toxin FitB
MFLLDTNTVSELMRPRPERRVLEWVAARPLAELAVAAVTAMEVGFGIAVLPDGRRRAELDARFRQLLARGFADRVLPFDRAAADACAEIRALCRREGRPVSTEDAMIAAVARVHGKAVVTRDLNGFERCGVAVVDPWAAVIPHRRS